MRALALILFASLLTGSLRAQTGFVTRESLSRQFVAYGPEIARAKIDSRVPLDPALLAVSCERIKQAVFTELGLAERLQLITQDRGARKIYLVIRNTSEPEVTITPIAYGPSYNYRVDLPALIQPRQLVESITEAVLLERANRVAEGTFTKVPRWFSQGLASVLVAEGMETLVLERTLPFTAMKVKRDSVAAARSKTPQLLPLSFEELSWPENLPSENVSRYDITAQFFVRELLRLKNGDRCLQQFLAELPRHLNWQVAFLKAFQPHFAQLIEVEKWWELRVVNLASLENSQQWTQRQSLQRLEIALRIPAEIYFGASDLPNRSEFGCREIISNWDGEKQQQALRKVIVQLKVLQFRASKSTRGLIGDYISALDKYVQEEDKGFWKRTFSLDHTEELKKTTITRLASLDTRRLAMTKKPDEKRREEAISQAMEVSAKSDNPLQK